MRVDDEKITYALGAQTYISGVFVSCVGGNKAKRKPGSLTDEVDHLCGAGDAGIIIRPCVKPAVKRVNKQVGVRRHRKWQRRIRRQ